MKLSKNRDKYQKIIYVTSAENIKLKIYTLERNEKNNEYKEKIDNYMFDNCYHCGSYWNWY